MLPAVKLVIVYENIVHRLSNITALLASRLIHDHFWYVHACALISYSKVQTICGFSLCVVFSLSACMCIYM